MEVCQPSGVSPARMGSEAGPLEVVGDFDAGVLEQGGREVDVEDHVVVDRAGCDGLRVADEQRHAQRLLVHEALVIPAVVAEKEALVGGIDDDGVVGQSFLLEIVEQTADVVID